MTDEEINKVCEEYSANDMWMLKQIINPVIQNFGKMNYVGEDSDYAEFLSDANLELVKILKTYDSEKCGNVYAYVRKRLPNKMYTVLTRLNRDVRMAYERDPITGKKVLRDADGNVTTDKKKGKATRVPNASLDAKNEEGQSLEDTVASSQTVEDVLFGDLDIEPGSRLDIYLRKLPIDQRRVAKLIIARFTPKEIKEILHISEKKWSDIMCGLRSYEYISIFYTR